MLCFTEALKLYRGKLTAFEQTEILDYPEIWFLGLEAKKIEGEPGSAQNNGYDDENGSYVKVESNLNKISIQLLTVCCLVLISYCLMQGVNIYCSFHISLSKAFW